MTFTSEAYVRKFDKVKLCFVTLTEPAMTKPKDYIYEYPELFWVERGEDEYGWHHYEHKVCAKLYRQDWLDGVEIKLD